MSNSIRAQGPFFVLFITLVVLVLCAPLAQEGKFGGTILQAGYSAVLLASIWGVRENAPERRALWLIGIPAVGAGWGSIAYETPILQYAGEGLVVVFTGAVITALLLFVARAKRVTANTLYASFSAYLLIGILFATLYTLLDRIQPGSLGLSLGSGPSEQTWDAYYFSLVTLTTLGYGDITPQFGVARSLAPLQALLGQLYLAALVARLVGLWTAQQQAALKEGER